MPLALGKEDTLDLSLDSDKKIPEEERPTFEFKFLSGRGQRKLAIELDNFRQDLNNLNAIDAIFELFKKYILGWKNIPFEFKEENFLTVLRWQEAQELLMANLHFTPQLEILKNLGLQLPTLLEESVKPESAGTAKNQ